MCNLYDIGPTRRKIRAHFEEAALEQLRLLPKQFGIRKTDPGMVVRLEEDRYRAEIMRWGFVREFNPSINNTRAEKLSGRMWRDTFQEHRCLLPVAAFYEWTGPKSFKQAHVIRAADPEEWLWCAGIWERSSKHGLCYSMITTAAPPWMTSIHDRIPALFDSLDDAERYLRADNPDPLVRPPGQALPISRCESPLKVGQPGPPVILEQQNSAPDLFRPEMPAD